MSLSAKLLMKVFSPRVIAKAVASLDKSTAIVVSACWLAALVMLILAVFAVHGAVSTKRESAEATAVEPVLPVVTNTPISAHEIQTIADRLQHQFPDIKVEIEPNQVVSVKSDDGAKFHQWITALTYFDTMAPQFRWTFREFCVGACSGHALMSALVSGQKVTFSLPRQ
jgi:hypothetical protein